MLTLPPKQQTLSGTAWIATKTCVFGKHTDKDTKIVLFPRETNEGLEQAFAWLYKALINGDDFSVWQQLYTDPPVPYINTVDALITKSKQSKRQNLLLTSFALLCHILKATPDKMILCNWSPRPYGENQNVPKEIVYHYVKTTPKLLLLAAHIYIPAAIALLEGKLDIPTELFRAMHDVVDTQELQAPPEPSPKPNNLKIIPLLKDFAHGCNQHLQESTTTPGEISDLLDPCHGDVI